MLKDIQWWEHYLPTFTGTSIIWLQQDTEPDEEMASDATMVGGGAFYRKQYVHFKFHEHILQQMRFRGGTRVQMPDVQ